MSHTMGIGRCNAASNPRTVQWVHSAATRDLGGTLQCPRSQCPRAPTSVSKWVAGDSTSIHVTLCGLFSHHISSPAPYVAKRKSSLFAALVIIPNETQPRRDSPLVASVSRGLPILMLLLGSHSVPLFGLGAVSPSVVEECARVLY